jgi:glycosyl hydrolase family 38
MLQTITELGKRIGAARYRNLLVTMRGSVRLRTMAGCLLPVLAAYPLLPSLEGQTMRAPDITKDPTLYVMSYAHLDTQWRWEMPQTISEYLLKTMRVNFDYIDKYPHYVFNWTGSNRYHLMKEYFPDDYVRLTQYVAAGRWFPAGSSVEDPVQRAHFARQRQDPHPRGFCRGREPGAEPGATALRHAKSYRTADRGILVGR